MPKYTDAKILDYVEKPNFKNQSFADWVESDFDYQSSLDPQTEALERAYFAGKRAEAPVTDMKLDQILHMEQELIQVLSDMEILGVYVDRDTLREISVELLEKSRLLLAEMKDLVGEDFNPLSAKQVQHILYERMGIPKGKKIKT
jgi:DNA polymerase I-like protein with 3'-5' exonuclease and polymerase domains